MAFWALGAFDKVKNISIGNVTKKLKDYVVFVPPFSKWPPKNNQRQPLPPLMTISP